jgi:hypothetical protein
MRESLIAQGCSNVIKIKNEVRFECGGVANSVWFNGKEKVLKERTPYALERWIKQLPHIDNFFDCTQRADIAVMFLQQWGYETKKNYYAPIRVNRRINRRYASSSLVRHVDVSWKRDEKQGRILKIL